MCEIITTALMAAFAGGGATAAGATATAATAGAGLANIGTLLAIGGTLYQGISANQAAKQNVALIEQQKKTEAQLTAVKDQRERLRFASSISQQSAELAGRGVNLNSPTAVLLGQTAAQEMAFNSQSIRSGGQARQGELTGEQLITSSRGRNALLKGGFSAAGSFLTKAPDMWPALGA
ncbi:MAG TPA: hypothetical protein DF966_04340 [Sulfitobacter sp.]|nr:hypothetical protein [Sulfitobacter sp.]|tara:strand:+ start:3042 stop:3575 length:534 start_codon:yes stop_codon:yes gene_type:complete